MVILYNLIINKKNSIFILNYKVFYNDYIKIINIKIYYGNIYIWKIYK